MKDTTPETKKILPPTPNRARTEMCTGDNRKKHRGAAKAEQNSRKQEKP